MGGNGQILQWFWCHRCQAQRQFAFLVISTTVKGWFCKGCGKKHEFGNKPRDDSGQEAQ